MTGPSDKLLAELQQIRRRYPQTAETMNMVIDLLADGEVLFAIDKALSKEVPA